MTKSLRKRLSFTQSGFTMIELLVVMAIIVILLTIAIVSLSSIPAKGRDGKRQADLKVIQSALEQYHADMGFYPSSWSLEQGLPLTSSVGRPVSPLSAKTYLNSPPADPITASATQYQYYALPNRCDNSMESRCKSYCLYAKLEGAAQPTPTLCANSSYQNYNYAVTAP